MASSATFVAGRESGEIDNTTNLYLDYLLGGKITVGTTPTDATHIQICVVGKIDDSTWPDVFDGTDSAETVTNTGIKNSICKVAADITVTTTSDVGYWFGPVSVAQLFGGTLPKKFSVFITHNTVAALHATAGNHTVYVTGVYATIA